MTLTERTLLVVDDDEVFRTRVVKAMCDRGLDAAGASDHTSALEWAARESPELALVDLRLPGQSGLDVIRDLKALDPSTVVVVLTGYGSIATAVAAVKLGAAGYLTKPADADQILAAFEGNAPDQTGEVPTLARVEWEHIQRVLVDCEGNISEASRRLGIHRRSLQRKLAKRPVSR